MNYEDLSAIMREHGGMSHPVDPMETYGTNDPDLKDNFSKIVYATKIPNVDEMVSSFPNESIIKILERRFRNTAAKLDDRYSLNRETVSELGEQIGLDFAIILSAIRQGKDLFSKSINASLYMGEENICDVNGLLDAYAEFIDNAHVNIQITNNGQPIYDDMGRPMDIATAIEYIKQQANTRAEENGIQLEGKQGVR